MKVRDILENLCSSCNPYSSEGDMSIDQAIASLAEEVGRLKIGFDHGVDDTAYCKAIDDVLNMINSK